MRIEASFFGGCKSVWEGVPNLWRCRLLLPPLKGIPWGPRAVAPWACEEALTG